MRRRDFIGMFGAAAALSPLVARAQQGAMPVVGYLDLGSPPGRPGIVPAFRNGLAEIGYVETHNVILEYRWAMDQFDRLPDLAADLVRRRVRVITAAPMSAALAAKAATGSIPIVFATGGDPVQAGLVTSMNRPGGNITGIALMRTEIGSKLFGLLRELMPQARRFAVLVNPSSQLTANLLRELHHAAEIIGVQVIAFNASTSREIDEAFSNMVRERCDGLLVSPQILFMERRVQVVNLAIRYNLVAIFPDREHADVGGLMSYGPSTVEQYRQAGLYTGRILKGEKPADLPVMQPSKFEFVINMQTARTLGIVVPPSLLATADEVIE